MADTLPFLEGWQASQQITDAGQENKLKKLLFDQKAQEIGQQNALSGILGNTSNYDDKGYLKREALPQIARVAPGKVPEYQQMYTQQATQQVAAKKAAIEHEVQMFDVAGRLLGSAKDQGSYDAARAQLAQIDPDRAARLPTTFDANTIGAMVRQGLSVKDQLNQHLEELKFAETGRHNQATERNAAGQLAVSQGQLGVSQGQLANSRARLAFDQGQADKGQIVQTDQGTMIVNQRTGLARPAVGLDGQPLQKPGKEIPASVNKSIIDNQQNIGKIDRALAAVDKYPGAFGLSNAIPGAELVKQYSDPAGVDPRAQVADIGSMVLHDRSGAAVTAAEYPRLKPFIPSASDKPEVVRQKLQNFRKVYEEEAGLLGQTYSRDQGYKPSPVLTGSKPSAAPAANGWSIKKVD